MSSWIANFLFIYGNCLYTVYIVGKQNLSPNCSSVDTSCGITDSDKLMNHLLLVWCNKSLDLWLNLWGSTAIL